jgi:Holliday junction DNA helicase RuvB
MANRANDTDAPNSRRSISSKPTDEDLNYEVNLRPRGFDDYVGQEQVKDNLRVAIAAARGRNDVLDHLLFHGPPGLGKTSLAYIISREMGVAIKANSGPVVERPGDLAELLTNIEKGDKLLSMRFTG